MAGLREPNEALTIADEEVEAEIGFQRSDLLCQCGLGDPEILRRTPDIQLFSQRGKISEPAEVHGISLAALRSTCSTPYAAS